MGQRIERFRSAVTGMFTTRKAAESEPDNHVAEQKAKLGDPLSSSQRRTSQVVAAQAFHIAESDMRTIGIVRRGKTFTGEYEADGVRVRVTIEVNAR